MIAADGRPAVLEVIAQLGSGGAERLVGELTRHLADEGMWVRVASSGGWRADALRRDGVDTVPVPLVGRSPVTLLRAARTLRAELNRAPADVVHVHNVKAALVTRLATLGLRDHPTVVGTLHGVAPRSYRIAGRLLRHCTDRLVAVSPEVARRLRRAGYPVPRLAVIENAVPAPVCQDRPAARGALEIAEDVPLAVCVARLAAPKRHDLLVDAWRSVPPPAVLLMAGDGPNRDAVARAVADAGLGDRVRMLGERQDVDRLLAAADVCVFASDWEGLPVSLLEAMAAGVPVLASDLPELRDTIAGAACLVPHGSARAFADAVVGVLGDPQRARSMSAAGRALVHARFDQQRMFAAYRSVLFPGRGGRAREDADLERSKR